MNHESHKPGPPGIVIYRAVNSDAAIIAGHRVEMFRDMGQVPTEELASRLLHASTSALAASRRQRFRSR